MLGIGDSGLKDRLLIIHGPQGVGKIDTISKAIWYAKEHEKVFTAVEDGAYLIDLNQACEMRDVYKAIKNTLKRLGIDGIEPKRHQILQSVSLKHK